MFFKTKETPKISVIIPTYNAEKYLHTSLDSLTRQTFGVDNFEVLIVDDKSTDMSVQVAKGYKKRLPNLTVKVLDKNSGGPMIPRNTAIDMAVGEYIMFMDNDDYLGDETLERFYTVATEHNSDVIFGKYVGVNGRVVPQSQFKYGNLYHADIEKHNLVHSLAPHKMFKTSFIRDLNLKFSPDVFIGEDQYFVYTAEVNAKVITVLADYDYYYVVNHTEEESTDADSNLSELQNKMKPEEIYKKTRYIMSNIDDAPISQDRKNLYKKLFIQRELLTHRSKVYSKNEKLQAEFLSALNDSVVSYVTPDIYRLMNSEYQNRVDTIRELDGKKLIAIDELSALVTASDVVGVQKAEVIAEINGYTFKVTARNSAKAILNSIVLKGSTYQVDAEIVEKLTPNLPGDFKLELVNRDTSESKLLSPVDSFSKSRAIFEVSANVLGVDNIWDVFVVRRIDGYSVKRRLGNLRLNNISLDGLTNGSTKAYFTKDFDNLSFKA